MAARKKAKRKVSSKRKIVRRKSAARRAPAKKITRKKTSAKKAKYECWHPVPLKNSFMAASILGFLISAYFVFPVSPSFAVAFMVVFAAMFIASIVSCSRAPIK